MTRSHRHEELEMNLVLSGRAAYLVGRKRVDLEAKSLVWFFPDEEHILIDTTPDFYFWLGVWQPSFLKKLKKNGAPADLTARKYERHHRKLSPPIFQRMRMLCEETSEAPKPAFENAQAFLIQKLWQVFSEGGETSGREVHPAVAQAARALQDEPSLDIAGMAERLELTPDHLSKLFRSQMGLPLAKYRTRQRLEKVLAQVRDEKADLTSAALAGGFGSYSAFHRAFHSVHHVSPREWFKR
ncbi:MAG: helix-turn-helix transcriptional regulator [Spirochaetia bacterium]|nr:helix-turn-helix transcriptional regulator [Spirochaetia bacterium]